MKARPDPSCSATLLPPGQVLAVCRGLTRAGRAMVLLGAPGSGRRTLLRLAMTMLPFEGFGEVREGCWGALNTFLT